MSTYRSADITVKMNTNKFLKCQDCFCTPSPHHDTGVYPAGSRQSHALTAVTDSFTSLACYSLINSYLLAV